MRCASAHPQTQPRQRRKRPARSAHRRRWQRTAQLPALEVLKLLDIASLDVVALTKEEGKHDKGLREERVFLQGVKEAVHLPPRSPFSSSSSRFGTNRTGSPYSFQKKRRGKELIKSALDELPGIGPTKKSRLLQTFGSVASLKKASDEELLAVKGITKKDLATLKDFFQKRGLKNRRLRILYEKFFKRNLSPVILVLNKF